MYLEVLTSVNGMLVDETMKANISLGIKDTIGIFDADVTDINISSILYRIHGSAICKYVREV